MQTGAHASCRLVVVERTFGWLMRRKFSTTGKPPALPEDSRSLTAPGVVCEGVRRELLKVYEKDRSCKRMKV
jgi:hypothetical protein